MATLNDIYRQRWQLIDSAIPYVPENGIPTFWRAHPEIGSPIGLEADEDADQGGVLQAFTGGIVRWTPESGAVLVTE